MRTFTFFLTLIAASSLGALSSPEPATAQETDIVGDWVLNRDKSDDPREVMARSRRGGNQGAARAGGGRGGGRSGGRKLKSIVGTELEVEIKAEWKKNRLEVEAKVSGGAKLKERYQLDEDTGELRVELDFSNTRLDQRIRLKQVYERRGDG